MANTQSDLITNVLSGTTSFNAASASKSKLLFSRASVASVSGDGAGHLYVLFRIPAHARIRSLRCNNTADAGWTDMNVGVYPETDWTAGDGTAIDADILVDGANRSSASAGPDELLGTGTNAYAETLEGAELWAVAGVASAPTQGTMYDIVVQSVGDPAGGGTMVWTIDYAVGG